MNRLLLDQDIRPLSEFRAHVASFVQQVRRTHRPLVITHRGKSAAVLLNVPEYEALLEQLELLQDVRQAEQQLHLGKGVSHEAAKKRVLKNLSS